MTNEFDNLAARIFLSQILKYSGIFIMLYSTICLRFLFAIGSKETKMQAHRKENDSSWWRHFASNGM